MQHSVHGRFSVSWCDQVCLVTLEDSFNREGVLAMLDGVRTAWQCAGSPSGWAYVMDLHRWEGGTPDGFETSRDLLRWVVAHGAKRIVRIHLDSFLARMTEGRGVFEDIDVPVVTVASREAARDWLISQGTGCAGCEAWLADTRRE
jgi:hypothetical protein